MSPELRATIEENGDNSDVVIEVSENGRTYEKIEADAELAIQNQQFVQMFERPILSLLSLYDRQEDSEPVELGSDEIDGTPVQQ